MRQRINPLVLSCVLIGFPAVTFAQPNNDSANSSKAVDTTLVALQYRDSAELAELLQRVPNSDAGILVTDHDPTTNSILLTGTEEKVAQMRQLIARLDKPGKAPTKKGTLRVYRLRFVKPETAADVLGSMLTGRRDVRMSTDFRTNAVVIFGSEGDHNVVEAVLKSIDVEPQRSPERTEQKGVARNMLLSVTWVIDDPKNELDLKAPSAKTLEVVRKVMAVANVKQPKIASQMLIRVNPDVGGKKTQQGFFANRGRKAVLGGGTPNPNRPFPAKFDLSCEGLIQINSREQAELQLMLGMNFDEHSSTIETSVTAQPNHPVCLGLTPVGGFDSMLIVEVLEQE